MEKRKVKKSPTVEELLQDLLIVELAKGGLTQKQIREAVGVDMNRVNRIAKHIKTGGRNNASK